MVDVLTIQKITIKPSEALYGTKKLVHRKGKKLEVTIPPGVKTGTLVKLSGALQITDGYYGDLLIQIKVKSRQRVVLATIIPSVLFIVIICSVVIGYFANNSGGGTQPPISQTLITEPSITPTYIYENGNILVGGDYQPIELINNPNAIQPTYGQLIAFIKSDTTDSNEYIEEGTRAYVCGDFAEDVHNNAEKAGIKAAWVSIDFEGDDEGHAINAFDTTDKGLVFIDCTGGSSRLPGASKPTSWDTVAYVEIGKEYGVIDIAEAKSLSYTFYEEYEQKLQEYDRLLGEYNEEVMRYNQEISGETYYEGSLEAARIDAWEASLEKKEESLTALREELGDWFEPLGIVQDMYIHW